MTEQEILYTMALTRLPRLNQQMLRLLMGQMGNATAIYEHRADIRDVLPEATENLTESLMQMDGQLKRAEEELAFAQSGHIQCICLNDEEYPLRLRDCPDAPILLYYRGTADLNARHIVSVVGTRQITEYGKDMCRHFIHDLSQRCPDVLVISGLAYGVDIHAHRASLENGLGTVGVLAHGLDQIYPAHHRATAVKMLAQGGLLTEFMSRTFPDKRYFVQRNRIVAGISDATIVVESASKGGSLITAEIAESYHRDVYAFPGRIGDMYSEGCNELIRSNRAALLTDAESFVQYMGWEDEALRQKSLQDGIQQPLFPDLNEEEQRIVQVLQQCDSMQINVLSVKTGLSIGLLSSTLFTLEMKGIVKMLNGGMYRLL